MGRGRKGEEKVSGTFHDSNQLDRPPAGAKKLAQHETGEELAEFKVVAAESMAMPQQHPVADSQRDRRHLPR